MATSTQTARALTIAALARDDDQERTRLWEKAPKQKYLSHEVDYVRVRDLANEFTTGFAVVQLGPPWAVVEVLGQTGDLIDELSPINRAAASGRQSQHSNLESTDRCPLTGRCSNREPTSSPLATAEQVHGFSAFSEHELGVEGVDMVAAFARVFLPVYKAFAALDADPVVVAKIAEAFQEAWRLRLQRQPVL